MNTQISGGRVKIKNNKIKSKFKKMKRVRRKRLKIIKRRSKKGNKGGRVNKAASATTAQKSMIHNYEFLQIVATIIQHNFQLLCPSIPQYLFNCLHIFLPSLLQQANVVFFILVLRLAMILESLLLNILCYFTI